MAVFTHLDLRDAERVASAHALGNVIAVIPIPAGSVNSNFFLDTEQGLRFVRIYEEQDTDGVAYEWRLLEHLARAGIPVPPRVAGPGPGALRVEGRPTGVFEIVRGDLSCQAGVTEKRAAAVGAALARTHRATESFPEARAGRFTLDHVEQRLDTVEQHRRPELVSVVPRLRDVLADVRASQLNHLPHGVIHGDLFRDNVYWEDDHISAIIDWESASDGAYVYDVMVTLLAWCFGASFEWDLARALVAGYESERPLANEERSALRMAGMAAALRFTTTRLTDFYLRTSIGERVMKDYGRFLARLETLQALSDDEVAARLSSSS